MFRSVRSLPSSWIVSQVVHNNVYVMIIMITIFKCMMIMIIITLYSTILVVAMLPIWMFFRNGIEQNAWHFFRFFSFNFSSQTEKKMRRQFAKERTNFSLSLFALRFLFSQHWCCPRMTRQFWALANEKLSTKCLCKNHKFLDEGVSFSLYSNVFHQK